MRTSEDLEHIITAQPELMQLRNSFEEVARSRFEDFLDALFDNHETLFGPDAPPEPEQIQLEEFRDTVRSLAERYVNQPLWQTPWLTHYLLVDVLESQLVHLQWASQWGVYPVWSLQQRLSSPYRTLVPMVTSLCIFIPLLGLEAWLVTERHVVVAALLGAWMVYFCLVKKPFLWLSRRRKKRHSAHLAQLLVDPVRAMKSQAYDPVEVSRRLQDCEQKDLHIPSVVFALLSLQSRPRTRS